MYNTLANGGFRSPLRAVRAVIDEHGKPLKAPQLEVSRGRAGRSDLHARPHADRSHGARHRRPARRSLPPALVVAGKTGTSNDYRDSWFSGFSGAT